MAEEYKITQKAMEKLKKEYSLVKVDGEIRGLILKSQENLLKKERKDYFCNPKNYILQFWKHIGFTLKSSAKSINENFKICSYGAKNPKKVYFDFTSGPDLHKMADRRAVLMTLDEAKMFDAVAQNHKAFAPGREWIDSTAEEVRAAIPSGKIKMPKEVVTVMRLYDLDTENLVAGALTKNGVEVVDYDEYLNKSDKPEPSNDQDLNKQLSTTARPGRKLDKKPQANTPLNKPKDETDTFSKTQRPRKSAKSFRPKINPADEE